MARLCCTAKVPGSVEGNQVFELSVRGTKGHGDR
jgi:hypothetical protein